MRLAPFDELNTFKEWLEERKKKKQINSEEIIDELTELYLLSYFNGNMDANEQLGTYIEPNSENIQKALDKKYDNRDFRSRVKKYAAAEDIPAILKVADTDIHRIYNEAVYNTSVRFENGEGELPFESLSDYAVNPRIVTRFWNTMMDDKVRDTHEYLEGMPDEVDGYFYTYDGDRARFPGDFSKPENNINCRCYLTLG